MATTSENYARFSIFQRVEHWILTLSFTLLAVTGLPQRYALSNISDGIIAAFGGLEATRVIHHVAAIVMIVIFLVHLIEIGYKFFVLRLRPTMLPTPRDVLDALQALGYNFGLLRTPPSNAALQLRREGGVLGGDVGHGHYGPHRVHAVEPDRDDEILAGPIHPGGQSSP